MMVRASLIGAAVVLCACSVSGRLPAPGPVRDLSRISAAEISRGHWGTADDIVRALRPRWLAYRGPDTILGATNGVQVRMDDLWLGGVSELRGVSRLDIDSLRFVDPVSAAGRWGGSFRDGVIEIFGRRGPMPDTSDVDTTGVDASSAAPAVVR